MNPDEYRPNPPAPDLRRCLRLEIEREGRTIAVTVEDPQSAMEVTEFFAIAREAVNE